MKKASEEPKKTAKRGQKKQSISGQRQQREKEAAGAGLTGDCTEKPISQSLDEKATIILPDSLKNECDFRNINSWELESCCYYGTFRESAAMRKSLILPTCTDQIVRSTLTFVLINAGWQKAAARGEVPLPWVTLKEKIREELNHCLAGKPAKKVPNTSTNRKTVAAERKNLEKIKGGPPFLASELPLECFYDPNVQDEQLRRWWEKAYAPALFSDAESYPVQDKAGTLTIQSALTFNSDATYKCELKTKRVIADKVIANGVTISGARVSFVSCGNSALPPGTVFTMIDNTAATPIAGTFNNLADGSTLVADGNTFQVSYEGGTGNDLTLTVVP